MLITKLEQGKSTMTTLKRAEIMKSIKMLSENIEKTKKELTDAKPKTKDKKQVRAGDVLGISAVWSAQAQVSWNINKQVEDVDQPCILHRRVRIEIFEFLKNDLLIIFIHQKSVTMLL